MSASKLWGLIKYSCNKAGYTAADASSSAISFYRPRVCARACVCVCLCMCMCVRACLSELVPLSFVIAALLIR